MENLEVIKASVGGNYELAPANNHVATCTQLIVLGTIEGSFNGHPKKDKKIILGFELLNTNHVFKEGEAPGPFVMHKEFTHSLNGKANLRKTISSWAGVKMDDKVAAEFNIATLVGFHGLVNVVHAPNAKGEVKATIETVSKLPEGTAIPPTRTVSKIFNVNNFKQEVFDTLPAWIQKKIQSSDEYKTKFGSATTASTTTTAATTDSQNPFATANVNAQNATKLF